MIKKILTVGDSFTYGEELANRKDAWPMVLSKLTKSNVVNQGVPGGGNKQMIRKVIDALSGYGPDQNFDLVIVAWTSPGRTEYADADGIFDLWPGYLGNLFKRDNQLWRMELLEYINKYHDPEYIYQQYIFDVTLLQGLLKSQGVKYLMLNTGMNEYYHNTWYTKMKTRTSLIDPAYYIGWPTEGMTEWTQGCKKGPNGHFLEDGHNKVAAKLYEHIRDLGWLS